MNITHRFKYLLLTALVLTPMLLLAQTNAPAGGAPAATSSSPSAIVALIPVAVPVLIALLKLVAPNLPTLWLPILAPILGAGADIALHYAGVSTLGAVWGALLGSAGVGLREIHDQLAQRITPTTTP
jgi:hypothetical protein